MIFLAIFLSSLILSGQNYELFNAGSKKLFTTYPSAGPTSGFDFDTVYYAGDYSIFVNYQGLDNNWLFSDSCQFWGGNDCLKQNKSGWFGSQVVKDFMNTYTFVTVNNNFLFFNFNLIPGDSSLFYQDSVQDYYFIFELKDTATVLSYPDSVKYYRIAHYDHSGNEINSPLNDFQIMIGKDLGLVNFFRIDSFPYIEQPVSLVGNQSPAAGLVYLTNEMVFDHHTGDEIEYLDQSHRPTGPPWENYTNYIKHTFLNRFDTQDSIIYSVERITYKTDSNILLKDTIDIRYRRNTIIEEIPFDKINQEHNLSITRLFKADYCGINLWTYEILPQYLIYCESDNCWGPYDIPGPPPDEETTYVAGLGRYLDRSSVSMPPPTGYSYINKVVYFKKDGIECGEDFIVGIKEKGVQSVDIIIYPNPAKDDCTVKINGTAGGELTISNLQGQEVMRFFIDRNTGPIRISCLESGLYLVKYLDSSSVITKKLIIQNCN